MDSSNLNIYLGKKLRIIVAELRRATGRKGKYQGKTAK